MVKIISKLLSRCLLGPFLALAAFNTDAFLGCEHEIVGNLSAEIAIEYLEVVLKNPKLAGNFSRAEKIRATEAVRVLREFEANDPLTEASNETYGGLNKSVDYVLYPMKILESWSTVSIGGRLPSKASELNFEFADQSKKARSAHVNDAHFQGHLLNSYVRYHRSAVLEANYIGASSDPADTGQLYGALVLNALADHYLQDFFAPGHIVTPRENFHDAFAMGWHDRYNRNGVSFVLNRDWINNAGVFPSCTTGSAACLEWHVDRALERYFDNSAEMPSSVTLYGDGSLINCSSGKNKQRGKIRGGRHAQIKLMLLAQSQSILDVIHGYIYSDDRPIIKLQVQRFKPPTMQLVKEGPPVIHKHVAEMDFGNYSFEDPKSESQWGATYPSVWKQYDTVFGINAGFQTIDSDEDNIRVEAGAEIVPFGLPGATNILRRHDTGEPLTWLNWAPIVPGFRFVGDTSHHGIGPSVRTIIAWPQVNLQLSVSGFYTRYSGSAFESSWKPGWNVRSDIGFSLLTAYIALGQDYAPENNKLDDGLVMSAGVQFTAPWRRLPLFSRLAN